MEEHGVSRLVSVSFDELDKDDPIKALEDIASERARTGAAEGVVIRALTQRAGRGLGQCLLALVFLAEESAKHRESAQPRLSAP